MADVDTLSQKAKSPPPVFIYIYENVLSIAITVDTEWK